MADSTHMAAARVELQALYDHHQGKLSEKHVSELESIVEQLERQLYVMADVITDATDAAEHGFAPGTALLPVSAALLPEILGRWTECSAIKLERREDGVLDLVIRRDSTNPKAPAPEQDAGAQTTARRSP